MQSWIHIYDLSNLFLFVLQNGLEDIYNAVAPLPVTNKELTSTAARILGKPFFIPNVPKFVMQLILGEMHTLLFESQNVSAVKIEDKGFVFQYKTIYTALQQLLIEK